MNLLHIIATPRGLTSNTARISNAFLEGLYDRYEHLSVTTLDLFNADLPAVAGSNIEAKYLLMTGQTLDTTHAKSWRQIEKNIETFLKADIYVITTPMWNLSIPYVLKYYIDSIVQPGYLFRYNEKGEAEGLAKGKKMLVVTSRGGDYSTGFMKTLDFVEPYLRSIFGFVGITDIQFINAQPMDITPEIRKNAHKTSIQEARDLAASYDWHKSENAAVPQPVVDAA